MMKNLTYRNLMSVTHKIEAKGYGFEEAVRMARTVFTEFAARPQGMSIEERVRRIMDRKEWEAQG